MQLCSARASRPTAKSSLFRLNSSGAAFANLLGLLLLGHSMKMSANLQLLLSGPF